MTDEKTKPATQKNAGTRLLSVTAVTTAKDGKTTAVHVVGRSTTSKNENLQKNASGHGVHNYGALSLKGKDLTHRVLGALKVRLSEIQEAIARRIA